MTKEQKAESGKRKAENTSSPRPAPHVLRPSSGMTLIELLVVLTILALLTTVAVTSSDVLLGQGRFDANKRILQQVEEAVRGPAGARQTDGTTVVAGFVADMGRLPQAASADPLLGLAELWTPPAGALPFAVRAAAYDAEVLVGSGWRGPYLRLPLGKNELRDGWGYPLELLNLGGTTAAVGQPIAIVRSLGADGALGGADYAADLAQPLADQLTVAVAGNVYLLDGDGQRQNPPDPAEVHVLLYGPNPSTGGLLETEISTGVASGVVSYSATITVGPRYLRAYYGTGASARKSPIVRFERSEVLHLEIR